MTRLYRAEAIAAAVIAAIMAAISALATWRGVAIDYASFAKPLLIALALLAIAGVYRARGRAPRISLTLASCAIFILFSNAGAVLNYLLLRPDTPTIDAALFRIDAALGFEWLALAGTVAQHPLFSRLLGLVYLSSLGQLALVIILLGFTGRRTELHRFLLVGIGASCLSMAVWAIAPSFGPSPYVPLPPGIEAGLGRVVDSGYGARLLRLLHEGPAEIRASGLIGVIAFPSMHTVMAAMSVYFTRRSRAFWPLASLNILMIPAILVHGDHHLIDVLGGLGLFAVVLIAVRRVIPGEAAGPGTAQLQTASGGRLIRIASMLPPVFRPNSVPRS